MPRKLTKFIIKYIKINKMHINNKIKKKNKKFKKLWSMVIRKQRSKLKMLRLRNRFNSKMKKWHVWSNKRLNKNNKRLKKRKLRKLKNKKSKPKRWNKRLRKKLWMNSKNWKKHKMVKNKRRDINICTNIITIRMEQQPLQSHPLIQLQMKRKQWMAILAQLIKLHQLQKSKHQLKRSKMK